MQKIMIVDDDKEHSKVIRELLETCQKPYDVTCVENGLECLQLLDKLSINKEMLPDLIILDIKMPEMDGWETFHHLRNNMSLKNIPVIFFSAQRDYFSKREICGDFQQSRRRTHNTNRQCGALSYSPRAYPYRKYDCDPHHVQG